MSNTHGFFLVGICLTTVSVSSADTRRSQDTGYRACAKPDSILHYEYDNAGLSRGCLFLTLSIFHNANYTILS